MRQDSKSTNSAWLDRISESSGADPTGTRAAIPARADSAAEIKKDSSEADADIEMTRRKAFK
jgi:hypothetical protein